MTNEEARKNFVEITDRISVVRASITEIIKKRLLAIDPLPFELTEKEASGTVERAFEHCEKAEKALKEGRIVQAMEHEAKCVKELP